MDERVNPMRSAVQASLDMLPRTGELLPCSLCDLSFMEVSVYERRNGYLAEHLTWDHQLAWQEVFRLVSIENRRWRNAEG